MSAILYFIKITPDEYVAAVAKNHNAVAGTDLLFQSVANKQRSDTSIAGLRAEPGESRGVHFLDVTKGKVPRSNALTVFTAKGDIGKHCARERAKL